MSDEHPRGILRNRPEEYHEETELSDKLDRNEVIKNTRLNAQLASGNSTAGDEIRAKIAAKKKEQNINTDTPEHLKWDEINLYKNEQEKSATMKIDEPKTPYEGGFNPEGEYYRDDNEEDINDIPAFELGEGEFDKLPHDVLGSLHGGLVIKDENQPDDAEEEQEEEEEEDKESEPQLSFEEKRKRHYHLKALPLKTHDTYVD